MLLSISQVGLVLLAVPLTVLRAAVIHYPPEISKINNLTYALTASDAPGIYDSSKTPDEQYGTYNWCNMPHVRAREYKTPSRDYQLQYVEVIQRHHKRTPYASNTFFKEDVAWDCTGYGPVHYGKASKGVANDVSEVQWQVFTDQANPWTTTVGPGFVGSNCIFPQITDQGLEDSHKHGEDLKGVYARRLGLGAALDATTAQFRVTNNVITSQVAGALIKGFFPKTKNTAVAIQSSAFDSLEPAISCPKSNRIRNEYTASTNANWTAHLTATQDLFQKLDRVSGIAPSDGGWHSNYDHYYDNLSAKLCHGKSLPCSVNDTSLCVTRDEANKVFRLGNLEYSYIFRDAPNSAAYAALRYGPFMLELKSHLQGNMDGTNQLKYLHNIAHDGSISALLGFWQISQMVWPGMGSEVVFELYQKDSRYFIRVLWSGHPIKTSTPMGVLDMVPIEHFFAYIDNMVGTGSDLFAACNAA